ncbi:HET-domain-containing protein, partial [Massarina eburnea CBS 473.64]
WLSNCLHTHSRCQSSSLDEKWYPTRLLRLEQVPGGDIRIRLQESAFETPSGPYIALSHRWGQANIVKLETKHLSSMKDNIAFEELPKTFQDAARVALYFDCHYLWIDSLCLIQNSQEDWLHEASVKEVYRHCLFTISATNPHSPETGLSSGRQVTIWDEDLWGALVHDSPLNKRGWTLQERFLSPRILHFSNTQLAWECESFEACELSPHGIEPEEHHSARLSKRNVSTETIRSLQDAWVNVVVNYSKCSTTRPNDKLLALSVVASYYQEKMKDTYLAGLWKNNFVRQLAWLREERHLQEGGATEYRAPSWSWAATDGVVDMVDFRYDNIKAELVNAETTLIDPDNPTGPVCGGSATLKGPLVVFSWEKIETGYYVPPGHDERENFEAEIFFDRKISPEHFFCFVLYTSRGSFPGFLGLVIEEINTESNSSERPRAFRRVGSVKIKTKKQGTDFLGGCQETTIVIV